MKAEDVYFFTQDSMPVLSNQGKIMMRNRYQKKRKRKETEKEAEE